MSRETGKSARTVSCISNLYHYEPHLVGKDTKLYIAENV